MRGERVKRIRTLAAWTPQPAIELPAVSNWDDELVPRKVMATMHTTAISATRSAYSTSDAPRSSRRRREGSQMLRYVKMVTLELSITGDVN